MNNIFHLKCAALATLLTVGSFGTAQAKSEGCNASNNIEGWGIWCGVETYAAKMTEENPTAAGSRALTLALTLEPVIDPNWQRELPDSSPKPSSDPDPDPDPNTPTPRIPDVPVPDTPVPVPEPVPDTPITFPKTPDPKILVGYTRTTEYTRSNEISATSKATLGTLTLKLDTAGVIQMTRFNTAGGVAASTELSGNDPIFGPPTNPSRSTRVVINTDPNRQSRASARKTTTSNDPEGSTYEEERFSAHEERQNGSEILKEYWVGTHSLYTSANSTTTDINTHFVAGVLTPLADIEKLSAGNVTATYRGKSAFWRQDVTIDVHFKEKRFDGRWEGGPFSFQASGAIVDQHIVSTSITGADSGFVQGSFFNPNAQALGGAYSATKGELSISDIYSTAKAP